MKFQATGSAYKLFLQRLATRRVSFAKKTEIHWPALRRFQHPRKIPCSRSTGRRVCTGRRTDNQLRIDTSHGIRVAGLTDFYNPPVSDANVCLDDSPIIDNECIGDYQVQHARRTVSYSATTLTHPVAYHLTAAKGDLVTISRKVLLNLDDKLCIRQSYTVARGGPVKVCLSTAWNVQRHRFASSFLMASLCTLGSSNWPLTHPLWPNIRRLPLNSTSDTSFSSPGSTRTAVPAGMFNRMPKASGRSNRNARLTSKK